ncbi:tetratricopeptide repeat protein [Sphingomonas sp. LB-2]|uniref:tetratricopeptide repeat protein n=1 Tax=Sphingomonas caeni TaxID=2984949 RepID=UPI0022304987|nr:tetratricopeptide repeat protein [Sphingomonas caeni]MCW3846195.1 tetratricopeptide repeat protein [Sphingomonas caeni]
MRQLHLSAGLAALLFIGMPAIASDTGGGGGGGGMSPSASAGNYDAAAEYRKGIAALQNNDFKGALKAFRNVLTVAPNDANTNFLAGLAAAGTGDDKAASSYFQKAVRYNANMIPARRQLGLTRAKLGDTAGAAAQRDWLQGKLTACGEGCADADALKAAIADIDAAIAAPAATEAAPAAPATAAPPGLGLMLPDAARGDLDYLEAVSLINEHRYADAIVSLEAARLSFGPHPDILTYLGFANRKLGRYDVAEGYYRAALRVYPLHRGALEYYGELKVERGDLRGARANLALLDRSCTFGCYEAEELRRWIALGHSPQG